MTDPMPKINGTLLKHWLATHNWSVNRLARECTTLGEDTIPEGTLRNALAGRDPIRPGRIHLIAHVTAKYGDGLSYEALTTLDPQRTTP
ncbi:hypothetical protein [Actinophytocola xinjiangensis]|nr:hypothetical protein [Actinophytocola xinjiangensis]